MKDNTVKLGTTTIGVVCKDGIVLAADKRVSSGNVVINHEENKIIPINDNIAVTTAGNASDAQLLIKLLRSELEIKEMRKDSEVKVKEAANLLARMVYQNIRRPSMIPGISHFILGGHDESGEYLYDIFADGTITQHKKYVASGSGSLTGGYGILDTEWKQNMSIDEGVKVAVKAINAALQRDMFTGDGVDVYTVTSKGVKKILHKDARVKVEA